jgi:hypothetical protein
MPGQDSFAAATARNSMATASLVFGVCSLLIPVLAVPGFILGVVSLRRIKRVPSLGGRGRSMAGIVTSLVLGTLGVAALVIFIVGGSSQLSMPRVQSGVRTLLQTDLQQQAGVHAHLQVQCPPSEPLRDGAVFTCDVRDVATNAQFTTEIRESDGHGDFIVGPLRATQPASSPAASTPESTTPPTVATVAPASASASLTGPPTNGDVAVISVDGGGSRVTVEVGQHDVTYRACSGFLAASPGAASRTLTQVAPGTFATLNVDTSVPCLREMTLLATPVPPQCNPSSSMSGTADVTWEGYDQSAHSVLYQPTGANEPTVAGRWCVTPTVEGPNHLATTLSNIPIGAPVQLVISNNDEWITGVSMTS